MAAGGYWTGCISYEDRLLPMEKLYALERRLPEALQERVWLPCGGYLIIQPTEALTVIDVNTGKFEGGQEERSSNFEGKQRSGSGNCTSDSSS